MSRRCDGIPGVVAHYSMDEVAATGACLHDDSGNGNDGDCVGGTVTLETGAIPGKAFTFTGETGISIPTTGMLAGGPFTIAGWALYRGDVFDNAECAFSRPYGESMADSWQFCFAAGDEAYFFYDGAAESHHLDMLVPAETWHHFAIVSTGAAVLGYVDGSRITDDAWAIVFDDSPIVLAGDRDVGMFQAGLVGALDDIWIFNYALDDAGIAKVKDHPGEQ